MDKYTVDLDKVLNDFEYSELTDNFNSGRAYLGQAASSYASSSKSRSGDAKHSITNVFHSLNEYLNTDISVSAKVLGSADSNKENVVQNSAPVQYVDEAQKRKGLVVEVTTGNLLDLTFSDESTIKRNVKEIDVTKADDNRTVIANEVDENDDVEADLSASGRNPEEADGLLLNSADISETNPELDSVLTDGHNLLNLTDEIQVMDTTEPNLEKDDDQTILTDRHILLSLTDEVADITEPHLKKDDDNQSRRLGTVSTDEHNLKADCDVEKDVCEEEIESEKNEVNLKDSEEPNLSNEVSDLENGSPDIKNDIPNLNNDTPNQQDEPNLTSDSETKTSSTENPNLEVIEAIESEETVVRYDDTIEIDDSLLNKFLDDLEVELEAEESNVYEQSEAPTESEHDNKEMAEEIVKEVIERCESVERPSMLRLASGSDDETRKREINLIGEPGSTPYNNLYVSKELSSENIKEALSKEKDNSVSPTFSEASTDTISDSSDAEMEQQQVVSAQPSDSSAEMSEERTEIDTNQTAQSEDCTSGCTNEDDAVPSTENVANINSENDPACWLGKQAPLWIPDSEALSCLHCDTRFTVIKRRHHCRACGLVLCSKCCNLKYRLEYLDAEARVCLKCYGILNRDSSSSDVSPSAGNSPNRQPNPNNPMEYCSVVPPLQQVGAASQNPPTVMVPVGVLKRKGSNKKSNKSVMFCDGIRPGSDLTKLDTDFDATGGKGNNSATDNRAVKSKGGDSPKIYSETLSFVPKDSAELPPLVTVCKSETTYFCNKYNNDESLLELLKTEKLTFALQKNIFVHVKIIELNCCIGKKVWCFSTEGFLSVGQDEIVYLIEFLENESCLPIDIFNHLNIIYNDALKGTTVSELGISLHDNSSFLDFKNHAGFLYVRPTFQCVQNVMKPNEPYLVGLLIHRWEMPWAKIFPLRLVLRLGAEYRYYPSPLISTRYRDSLFVEVGHTIITVFADFRNFSYTLPNIRGLTIHMQDKNTTVNIPTNRYDQVMSSLNNSSDHILVLGGNFSTKADSHLVCIQDTQSTAENAYTTHAINIQNRPRKVTGASFIVFNGALKSTSGLTAKSSIVEDGLMIQIPAEDMGNLRESLRGMKNYVIQCGCVNAPSDETVNIIWGDVDNNFNMGVVSPIDNQSLSGVPSIRVHNGKNYTGPGHSKMIRWTEVFILENTDEKSKARDPLDISKISENIAKATCAALVKYLDLLCSNNFFKIGIRTTLHVENVSYSAGSNNVKLPPIYMKSLDNELIPVLHRIVSNNLGDDAVTLELIFRILNS